MKDYITIFIFFLFIICGIFSCKKDPGPTVNMGYNYFPDKVGHYVIYQVDSFYYNDFNSPQTIDTFKFQLKEKIQSIFTDNEGRPAIRLERYIKKYNDTVAYSAMSWTLRNVWTENLTARTAEKVEDNERFVKLVFPVKEGQKWDGNAQNILGTENYKYKFFDLQRTYNSIVFDSVLQVDQHDEENLLIKKYYIEQYARNVGLIYKEVINVESQPDSIPDPGLAAFYAIPLMHRLDNGIQYTETVVSYGVEP